MALPEDDVVIVQETSCSIDTAVAKMLGWLRGSVRRRLVPVTEYGIPAEALPTAHSLGCTVAEQLRDLRDAARAKLFADPPVALSEEDVSKMDSDVAMIDELTERAAIYRAAISDELARGSDSMLHLDQINIDSEDEIRITLSSLNDWARIRFGLVILPISMPEGTSTEAGQQNSRPIAKSIVQKPARTKHRDQESAILEEIRELGHDPQQLPPKRPGYPGVKAKVKEALSGSELFSGSTVFDKAWERLREYKEVADKK